MIPLFKVVKSGVYSSIQDRGRFGFRKFGVPVSGPMDREAFELGHKAIGNEVNETALELFLGGLSLEVLMDHRIIITGANLGAIIDGQEAPMWKTFSVKPGQILSFPKPITGSIAYIIPEGGFSVKRFLGSKSSYYKGQIGDAINKETILYANSMTQRQFNRGLLNEYTPSYEQEISIELFKSPHMKLFEKTSIERFLANPYTFRGGDRMGYFFNGQPLEFNTSSDIVSEATQFGTVQVPTNGQPIILMADSQTIGGYATIGTVVKEDLAKVAQLRNGGKVRFSYRSVNENSK